MGDTGGIKDPEKQMRVAECLKKDLFGPKAGRPMFCYHLGDVVYFNGEKSQYYPQFYEPYDHYDIPIFSIPGNHDGDPVSPDQASLDGWVEYFMTPTPEVDPISQDAPRLTQCQPNVYFTLLTPYATIIGLYTNVPEGGSIDSIQQQWFTNEMDKADEDKALIVALHHPIYSFDDHHSGSTRMADVLQHGINDSRRVPNAVFTAHVHNYQRIEQKIGNFHVPFFVVGNGGYHHLHHLNSAVGTSAEDSQAKLIYGNDKTWGYLTVTVDGEHLSGEATAIDKDGNVEQTDTFNYPVKAQKLTGNQVVSL